MDVGYAILRAAPVIMPRGTLPPEPGLRLNFPILLFTLIAATLGGLGPRVPY